MFTSGVVSIGEGHPIALFFTGCKHAGENLAEVLKQRPAGLSPHIQMCDALSRNIPKLPQQLETLLANCLVHARRNFVKVTASFLEECRFVLETLGVRLRRAGADEGPITGRASPLPPGA